MQSQSLNRKPMRLWGWREYKTGSLIENGIALNDTGTFIWKLCDGKTPIAKIVDAAYCQFDVRKSRAEKDTIKLIQLLIDENALRIHK